MLVVRSMDALGQLPRGALCTIGTYDGIHRAHHSILEGVVDEARRVGCPSLVLCFDPPAWKVLGRGRFPFRVTTVEDKLELLESIGVSATACVPFDPALLSMDPEDFVALLLRELEPRSIWVGHDFRFGHGRGGTARDLEDLLRVRGCGVRVIEAIEVSGQVVSASRIRELVLLGKVEEARSFLGRPHFLRGRVVAGDGRGKELGFPTANLDPFTELLPQAGVYATTFEVLGGGCYPSTTNMGFRPTFNKTERAIETHVLDAQQDWTGAEVRVHVWKRLRDERRFGSVPELVEQIERDVEQTRALLPFPAVGGSTWQR